jgi:hypothetical protein|tara:strand:+ start:216 stop:365 length:150 start_codon:yes stop_codon:yes gene_type:complete
MATKWSTAKGHDPVCGVRGKKTSIGRRNIGTSSMPKARKASFKRYRGQG